MKTLFIFFNMFSWCSGGISLRVLLLLYFVSWQMKELLNNAIKKFWTSTTKGLFVSNEIRFVDQVLLFCISCCFCFSFLSKLYKFLWTRCFSVNCLPSEERLVAQYMLSKCGSFHPIFAVSSPVLTTSWSCFKIGLSSTPRSYLLLANWFASRQLLLFF